MRDFFFLLQWGRAQMRAEGVAVCKDNDEIYTASMGPRADARGRPGTGRVTKCGMASFNGAARRCARKARSERLKKLANYSLQWGRAQMRAEGS